MNEIVQRRSITADMAEKFGMETSAFESTIKATIFDGKGTREQFAAFLLVAKQYDLNPLTKEIYAFPSRGGIIPVVSIDGWVKLINSHPMMDGMEFTDNHDADVALVSVTCSLWRKDRSRPVVVTEYLSECFRPTDAWKMKHRMLRHKTLIQCARYAFGFAGIYDPDEGERILIAQRLSPPPKATTLRERMPMVESFDPDTGEITESETVGEVPPTSSASGAGVTRVAPVTEGAAVGEPPSDHAAAPTYSAMPVTKVVLSAEEREDARDTGMTDEEYARAKLRGFDDINSSLPNKLKKGLRPPISLREKGDAVAKHGEATLDKWVDELMDDDDRAAISDDLLTHWRAIAKEAGKK